MGETIKNISEILTMGFKPKPIITESFNPRNVTTEDILQEITKLFNSYHQPEKIFEFKNSHRVWTAVDGNIQQMFLSHIQTAKKIACMSDASRFLDSIVYREYTGLPLSKYTSLTDLSIVIVTNLGDGLLMTDPFNGQGTFIQKKGRYPHASHLMIRQLK